MAARMAAVIRAERPHLVVWQTGTVDAIKGIDGLMKEAVNLKFIGAPLTQKQLDELIQIPPRKK